MRSFTFQQIATVQSEYVNKYDAPRQPRVDERNGNAILRFEPHRNFEQALQDLEGFEHIWLLSIMDRALNWKPKVLPPRSEVKRGVFATRSPHRPNPIAISVVKLLRIEGLDVHVTGSDLLHNTPIIDIKPYLPYVDALHHSKAGWVDMLIEQSYEVSGIMLVPHAWQAHVERVLSTSPLPHPYKRIRKTLHGTYELAVQDLRVCFVLEGMSVVIINCYQSDNAQP